MPGYYRNTRGRERQDGCHTEEKEILEMIPTCHTKHFPLIKFIDNRKNVCNTQNINNLEMWLGICEGKIPEGHSFVKCGEV